MLERYRAILEGNKKPYYLDAKRSKNKVDYSRFDTSDLWAELDDFRRDNKIPPLDLKYELVDRIYESCFFCERKCEVDRKKDVKGYCDVEETKISSEFLHMGEERELVPSHTIFFAGCNFRCIFCQNYDISQLNRGKYMSPDIIADRIKMRGGKNVNWVGGDPTPHLPYVLKVLMKLDACVPQLWNSNMYLSESSMKILSQLVDVYLTDFKYGNDECAKELSDVEDYTFVLRRNHMIAEKTGDLIIRHLVLPGHIECCTKPLLKWIDNNLENPRINIMTQYRPVWHADQNKKIDRYLSRQEKKEVKKLRKKYC